ncbi:ParA family protein [uncultured Corynebacterium sp.]|uniref:ParA family protein n=1 Tax=uncultured Corynebacterium sp. TaxID=159447 RepID=UPI0025919C53|nr:hypothetical protein [uncultured Corynebacterium sp.]
MLTEEHHEKIYLSSKNDEQAERDSLANTVYSLFIPLREGETDIEPDIRPVRSERFGVDVLPGHPALSNIEDVMSDAWQSSLAKKTGDFRRIHWAGQLAVAMEDEDRYDYIFYDLGPSLGPFNRTMLFWAATRSLLLRQPICLFSMTECPKHNSKNCRFKSARVQEGFSPEPWGNKIIE